MSGEVCELLMRHPDLFDEHTLLIGVEAGQPAGWSDLITRSGTRILTWDWLTAQAWQTLAERCTFGVPQAAQLQDVRRVILLWSKSKPLSLALLELIAGSQPECWVAGANDAGGKSIGKACAALTASAEKTDSARHCSLWHLDLKPGGDFNWLKQARSFQFAGQAYLTLPGVFNHGTLDAGTALLLEHLPAPAHGRLLDLGCGSGVIGLSMKAREPALQVTLADVDAFAVRSSQLNSMRLNLEADIRPSDCLQNIDGRFDYIISNPPFHQGKETNYRFARQLFLQGRQHLTADGQIWIVANRHLPYEEWAREAFREADVMAQENGFKLICIRN